MTKRKEERRELLKEDEFHSILDRGARYIQQNTGQAFTYLAGFFVIVAVFFWWMGHLDNKRDAQASELYKAEKVLATELEDKKADHFFENETEKLEKALVELDKVIAEQSGSVRQQAIVRKVGVLVNLGRQDEVRELYGELIAENGGLKVFGLMGMAEFYLAEDDYSNARAELEKIKALRNAPDVSVYVKYKLAEIDKEEGNVDAAKTALKAIIDAYAEVEDAAKKPPILNKAQQLYDELDKDSSES